ncbi:XRE family transcriptional regulator [Variovorax atrisoli]|uniref:LexA family transcriptional regulator n=1 Tax=Variovorax atrisoli TaxID=3394203 RepID=UPI000F7E8627|nr:XRE family transcriptional regulator [Variovorax sp. 369]RTD94144.1 XRE family transcriptional regulator [Variovorax sp. 369]
MLFVKTNSDATVFEVTKDDTNTLEGWQREDAARLLALYKAYRAAGGLKQDDFAAKYGLRSQANLGHYLHGRRPLNIEQATNFARGLNVPIGEFSPTIAAQIAGAAQAIASHPSTHDDSEFVPVQRLTVRLSAGPGAAAVVEEVEGSLQFRRDFLSSCGATQESARIVHVTGTSMEPTIVNGAVLLVNTRNREPRNGSVFAMAYGDDLIVKRLIQTPDGWVARSDNPDGNPDISMNNAQHVEIIGRAVWMGAKL